MKTSELTTEQLLVLADKNPEWVANYRPKWTADNYDQEKVPADIMKLLAAE